MGYGYDSRTGRQGLCCDACGTVGGVRKVKCPHIVYGSTLRSPKRVGLPYCPTRDGAYPGKVTA